MKIKENGKEEKKENLNLQAFPALGNKPV